jgi:hypothetical protein
MSSRFRPLIPSGVLVAAIALVAAAPARAASPPPDGIRLRVTEGPTAGELDLSWQHGVPDYKVFRSNDPATVLDPGNEIATVTGTMFTDPAPPGNPIFYKITSPNPWATAWTHTTGDQALGGEQEYPHASARTRSSGRFTGIDPNIAQIGPVLVHSGEVMFELQLPSGILPGKGEEHWGSLLTYRSQIDFPGPVGNGWNLQYLTDRIGMATAPGPLTVGAPMVLPAVKRYLSHRARFDDFVEPFLGAPLEARGWFESAELGPGGTLTVRDRHGYRTTYNGFVGGPDDGTLLNMVDRNGNLLEFQYDINGQLNKVIDSMGREIMYQYGLQGGHMTVLED